MYIHTYKLFYEPNIIAESWSLSAILFPGMIDAARVCRSIKCFAQEHFYCSIVVVNIMREQGCNTVTYICMYKCTWTLGWVLLSCNSFIHKIFIQTHRIRVFVIHMYTCICTHVWRYLCKQMWKFVCIYFRDCADSTSTSS